MTECKKRSNWGKWKEAIEAEITSLYKRQVFSEVMPHLEAFFLLDTNGFCPETE
jgi:hypothetical protein